MINSSVFILWCACFAVVFRIRMLGLNDQPATKECINFIFGSCDSITNTKPQNEPGSHAVHITIVVRLPSATQLLKKLAKLRKTRAVYLRMGLWVHRNRPLHVVCTVTESFSELHTQQLRKILKPLFSVIKSRKALRYGNPCVKIDL